MAVKKSELYGSLWASCDSLRGGMDSSQYKDYILTLLFVKYVSDKSTGNPYHKLAAGPYNPALKYKTALPIARGLCYTTPLDFIKRNDNE